jgi:hypothetical protein
MANHPHALADFSISLMPFGLDFQYIDNAIPDEGYSGNVSCVPK